ncbi:hypothetical protein V7T21_14530, partial [Segatella copri]|uniref:hypothetical protein n=1 Tax=Segatella copri TaxID=165179 RepID=UPI002FF21176
VQKSISLLKDEMLLGQELKFKNKLCNLKLGTFFSALPGLGVSAPSGRVGQNLRKFNKKEVQDRYNRR